MGLIAVFWAERLWWLLRFVVWCVRVVWGLGPGRLPGRGFGLRLPGRGFEGDA